MLANKLEIKIDPYILKDCDDDDVDGNEDDEDTDVIHIPSV